MSFVSALRTSQLPEKPWQTGPVVRFVVSVVVGILMGAVVAMVISYFEAPQTSSAARFLALAALAFTCYVAAIVVLFRQWPMEGDYLFKLIWLLGFIYGGILFTWLAGRLIHNPSDLQNPVLTMLIAVVAFQGFALAMAHFFIRQYAISWRAGFGLDIQPGQALMIGVGVGILALYPIMELNGISFHLFEKLTLHPHEQQTVEILRHADTLAGRIAAGIATVLIAPIGEEIIFRGVLYPWAKRRFSPQLALWGTAIVFGAVHANLSSFVPLVVLAILLVSLYEYTGNLLAPIAVHSVFNGANFVLLYYFNQSN